MHKESAAAIPRASYRLQFNLHFGFADAARIAPYLSRLGISHVYASPYLMARPGSQHGYDIVAHDRLNPELGDEMAFQQMVATFKQHGLKQILDFVPNHMGVGGADNPLWLDVLEWGIESRYARWFDIDWEPNHQYLRGKVLAPFLGNQYGIELESGKLVLKFDSQKGEFAVWAYDTHKLPISPLHYESILGDEVSALEWLGDDFSALLEWRPQLTRKADELKQRLVALVAQDADASHALTVALDRLNAHYQQNCSRSELDALIQQQHWRVTDYRVAGDDINYRRFFNINDLAGIRVELPDVFEHVHQYTIKLVKQGLIDGLRIDHIDGLIDPAAYLKQLRSALTKTEADFSNASSDAYLVVEKILSDGEQLRSDWPVHGTTGYDFCNLILGILIDPRGEQMLSRCYADFIGKRNSFAQTVRESKLRIMNNEMASELNVLARDAARVAKQTPRTADFTRNLLLRAIREIIACFTLYRTYLNGDGIVTDEDIEAINAAVTQARTNEREISSDVFDFLENMLCGKLASQRSGFIRHTVLRCAMKLQQYSGPVMAKGLEDTAFYRFNRFVALNEVGGNPDRFGISIEQFHIENSNRANQWPHSMLCTSTHDTKRGEDARARLAVISEMADEWTEYVGSWKAMFNGGSKPSAANELYLLFQLLVATWPAELTGSDGRGTTTLSEYIERLKIVMRKSVREARQLSSWTVPNDEYENEMIGFIDKAFDGGESNAFMNSFLPFQARVAVAGANNSLIQTALKFCGPGMPDTYQGSELWDLNMVDPDNRRAVDFQKREALLINIIEDLSANRERTMRSYMKNWQDGRVKLAVIYSLLNLRQTYEELFTFGSYEGLTVQGSRSNQICAFVRQRGSVSMLVIVARFFARKKNQDYWQDTSVVLSEQLQVHSWHDALSARTFTAIPSLSIKSLLEILPVAVLIHE